MRRIIYLSGPMTGEGSYQRKFVEAADQLLEIDEDLIIINPATMTQTGIGKDIEKGGYEYQRLLDMDIQLIADSDAICLLPGWENSHGCRDEVQKAIDESLDIFVYNDPDLYNKLRAAVEGS